MRNLKRFTSKKGFTLIELLVVVAILATVVGIGLVSASEIGKRNRDAQRKADLKLLSGALEDFYADWQVYPAVKTDFTNVKTATRMSVNGGDCDAINDPSYPIDWGGAFSCETRTYLSSLPKEPKPSHYSYLYYQGCIGKSYVAMVRLEGRSPQNVVDIKSKIDSIICDSSDRLLLKTFVDQHGYNYSVTSQNDLAN